MLWDIFNVSPVLNLPRHKILFLRSFARVNTCSVEATMPTLVQVREDFPSAARIKEFAAALRQKFLRKRRYRSRYLGNSLDFHIRFVLLFATATTKRIRRCYGGGTNGRCSAHANCFSALCIFAGIVNETAQRFF
jgi:hypothetical protein